MSDPTLHTPVARRRGWHLGSLLALPAYLAATLAFTWPLARDFRRFVPTVVPLWDSLLQAFLLHWDLRTLFTHSGRVFDAPLFHPERNTLTYTDHHLGEAVLVTPVTWFTDNTAVPYNVLVVFTCVASAWAMYRLARLLGAGRGGGFIAGLLFAFSPYRYCNMANLNLLHTYFIPLGIFFALRYSWNRRTRDLVAMGLTLAAQSYFSWYYTFYLGTALALVVIHALVLGRMRWRELLSPAWLATAAATFALVLPGVLPYLREHARTPGFERTLGMASYWSADLLDYLKTNPENVMIGRLKWLTGEQPYFPGLVAAVLAIVALMGLRQNVPAELSPQETLAWMRTPPATRGMRERLHAFACEWRRRGDASYFLLLGATGFILSLGPILRVAGHRVWIPLPYAALWYIVPGFQSMRASGRYSVLVLTAVVALAALGYEVVRRRLARAERERWMFPVALAVTTLLTWSVPWPMVPLPQRDELPPIVLWLERQPGEPPVLNLPMPAREEDEGFRDVTRQIHAIYHRKPLVDGVTGFVPLPHRHLRQTMQRFPAPDALSEAARFGTRIIVVHFGDWDAATRARLRAEADASPGLRRVAAFGDDVAYELLARAG